jgi:hypothetical protein
MYYAIAVIAYILTMDCIQGGTLAQDMGITAKEASNRMYDLFRDLREFEQKEGK